MNQSKLINGSIKWALGLALLFPGIAGARDLQYYNSTETFEGIVCCPGPAVHENFHSYSASPPRITGEGLLLAAGMLALAGFIFTDSLLAPNDAYPGAETLYWDDYPTRATGIDGYSSIIEYWPERPYFAPDMAEPIYYEFYEEAGFYQRALEPQIIPEHIYESPPPIYRFYEAPEFDPRALEPQIVPEHIYEAPAPIYRFYE